MSETADSGIISLLPPLAALVLALVTHNVILSLAVGVFCGFFIVAGYNPLAALIQLFENGLFKELAEPSHASLLLLLLVVGGFVGLLEGSGGMKTFARQIARWVRGPVGAQLAVWFGGMGIFFSDSATPLILGPIFRPVMRRVGISREKLAYIIDSTASPVCVLVPFISWGVYIMSLIDQSYEHLGIKGTSFDAILQLLPMQFYPILALAAVPMIILTRREWGPMAAVQRRLVALDEEDAPPEEEGPRASLLVIAVPMLTLLTCIAALFTASYLEHGELSGARLKTSMTLSYLTATATAIFLLRVQRVMTVKEGLAAFRKGVENMLLIPLILLFAWSLGSVCQMVNTGGFLADLTHQFLTPGLLSPVIFVVAAVISFAMGSAWGTFAILMPIAISIAHGMNLPLIPSMAAVLSGGLFGDHASPISDTTILASMGAGCRHIDHVRTQLPYALMPATVSLGAFAVTSFWQSPLLLPAALLVLAVCVVVSMRVLGAPVSAADDTPAS